MKAKIKTILIILPIIANIQAQQAEWTQSTQQSLWQKPVKVKMVKATGENADIVISNEKTQVIDGFGGCFNELGWDALATLPEAKREEVLRQLFSPQEANFTYNRMPMGASDYALSYYSFNDVAEDFNMVNFNIDRDRYILLPYIKAAKKYNPAFKLWASPWTPPAWMKTNRHYGGHPDAERNGLRPEYSARAEGSNNGIITDFIMLRGYLEAYALYFAKFIKAYEKEGVPIFAVHVQNEPRHIPNFPCCSWQAEDLACFIGYYLGPKFQAENIATDIYFGTLNIYDPNYLRAAMNYEKAAPYIKGAGFQWDGKQAIPDAYKEYPRLKLVQTESECGDGSNDWKAAEHTWDLLVHYLSNGANAYNYWNMVLDDTGFSTWGWKQNALISINKVTGETVYNPEFYLMKHISRYVLPGAYRLVSSRNDNHLAFINPDGKIVVIIVNKEKNDKTVKISWEDKLLSLELKAQSFNTICF